MKLSDKPLELRPVTVGAALDSFRALGREQDAKDIEQQLKFVADFTNWTIAELRELEWSEYPELARQFAQKMGGLRDSAINPPTATASESGQAESVAASQTGSTS